MFQAYSFRQFSRDSDYVNAFAGIMSWMRQREPPRYSIWGLPYIPEAYQNPLEVHLFVTIAWYHPNSECERRKRYPSWTWAD